MERRGILKARTSPDFKLDCISTLEGKIGLSSVSLRYVPDKHILDPKSFGAYLKAINDLPWESPEAMTLAILDDVNNEIVARWTRITVTTAPETSVDKGIVAHSVMVEDRQPKWDNPALLSGLKRN
ncbi:MAG: hypothetical protein A3G18_10115 [Rhodospirillales bacterium RIFCSPLOWO2_12_FULL_58_28]|nr:MAG: hypothetical protein A3H92_08290 [Rhodospirillales bacterium RIFCSPLOWO2_02_FULL_58_16]OHC77706.1 MAG: hypothetical protein A3G18_10115 [Rhodospirillales bacterium RIFCSPLOWO2_12_FULL_58_28]